MKLKKLYPTYAVVKKDIKKPTNKKTYKDLNTDLIKQYISLQENKEILQAQYKKAFELGKFPTVRKWFLDTFKNFDVEEAKKEISEAVLAQIRTATVSTDNDNSSDSDTTVIQMPEQKTA